MARVRKRYRVAAVQLNSTHHRRRNLEQAETWVRRAAESGADLIALPENFAYLRTEGTRIGWSEAVDGPVMTRVAAWARETRCWILAGSIPERIPRSQRVHNTSVLLDPAGRTAAVYRKLHLFDIAVRGGAVLQESRWVRPGAEVVVVETALGRLGLSICYDLRFPELYRRMAARGARVLFVPAAFTAFTGPDHWLPLLRARAIENLCWVVAPAQTGRHNARRASHGHTVVLDPWGRVTALRESHPGLAIATIDLEVQDRLRRGLPCLRHARKDLLPG